MTNPVFESMTRLSVGGWVIRVWRDHESLAAAASEPLNEDVRMAILRGGDVVGGLAAVNIAISAGSVAGVSAVEVLNSASGDGILYYPDWR